MNEKSLVKELKEGNRAAFGLLYDNYSAALYGVAYRIVRSEEIAEEVVNDAFVKFHQKIATYDSEKGRLFTWMVNICRNLAIDTIRSKSYKNSQKTNDIEGNVFIIDRTASTHQNPDTIGIRSLVGKLKPEQELIVNLLYFKGYTQAEVAKEYDIPLGTVKTRLRMAIKVLRKLT